MWDVNAPSSLKEIQTWFAKIITIPINHDNKLPSTTPWGSDMAKEALPFITPTPLLAPHERIELYHQQYWWRLLEILQENFPTLTRLFGYVAFNRDIAIPYLTANPSQHYSLSQLGHNLPEWVENNYHESKDRTIVTSITALDWAFNETFFILEKPPLVEIGETPITLQPHIHLFALTSDLFTFREEFLKNSVDHFASNPFPPLNKEEGYYVLFRTLDNHISWEKIPHPAYLLLSELKKGSTLQNACNILPETEEVEKNLSFWFYTWAKRKWFTSL